MPKKEKTKIIIKECVEDNVCDLTLSELTEVPVTQIAAFKRITILDLSSNRLATLGKNFVTLTRLVKLDLSKNQLKYLPEDFGLLNNLRHLDLYDNKLEHLPLSFGELVNLRYLDLKGNPLVPALLKIVGFCSTTKECQDSARNTVKFMASMQIEADKIKERIQQHNQLGQQEEESDLCVEKSNSDYNQNMSEHQNIQQDHPHHNQQQQHSHHQQQQQQQQQQQKSKRSNKKQKNKVGKNAIQNSTQSKAVQTTPVEIGKSCPATTKAQRLNRKIKSTALSSIVTFITLLVLNVFIIYLVMFKNPEVAEFIVNIIPQQYRNWIAEKTEFFRLRVTDYISNFMTPPEEH